LIFSDDDAAESLRLVMVVCYELCIYYLVTRNHELSRL
jgi:hypothetical protein